MATAMMEMAPRYAIYFVPAPHTALYRFGAAALGYDCHSGKAVPFLDGVGANWPSTVQEPSVYGFHATLKAPFRLPPAAREADLLQAARIFAEDQPVVDGGHLQLRALGSFVALVPAVIQPDIDTLAARCVEYFEPLRAPLSAEDRARRLKSGLSQRQIALLDRWGYSYVFEEFRFHMTLTGALDDARRGPVIDFLKTRIDREPAIRDLTIDRIAVMRQDRTDAPSRVIAVTALGHSVYRPFAHSF